MAAMQPVRGTHDWLGDDARKYRSIIEQALKTAQRAGFDEIATPIFEFSEVFHRTLGDASDIVTKETYNFTDRGGEQLTLRPEGTAAVARAFISNGLRQNLPVKVFYAGPMFRCERPQKGRLRQFHQIGVEILGVDKPSADVEVMVLAYHILQQLGVAEKCALEINTLGDEESRNAYRTALVEYFSRFQADLSSDSQERLVKNPLRILDSKDDNDRKLVADAPIYSDYLTPSARAFFDHVCGGLASARVPFRVEPRLVRGLDYYGHTAFEFVTTALSDKGPAMAVLAGGRYDGLIETMGGSPTPGIGWAAGIERLGLLASFELTKRPPLVVAPAGTDQEQAAWALTFELRQHGFSVEQTYGGNLGKRLQKADKLAAPFVVILGENEITTESVTVKNLKTGNQEQVSQGQLISWLEQHLDR